MKCASWMRGRNEATWSLYSTNMISAEEVAARYVSLNKSVADEFTPIWARRFAKRSARGTAHADLYATCRYLYMHIYIYIYIYICAYIHI